MEEVLALFPILQGWGRAGSEPSGERSKAACWVTQGAAPSPSGSQSPLLALTSSKQIISSGPVSAPSGERVNYASDIISLEGKRAVLSDSSISHWLRAFKLLGNSRFL